VAEEKAAPEAELERVDAPGDEQQEEQRHEAAEPSPVEALASRMGWSPKDQWHGDEAEWKPADEFILAGRDINRNVARKLSSVEEQLQRLTRTSADMTAAAVEAEANKWRNIHAKAVEEGDAETAGRAVDQIVKIKQATQPEQGEPPETRDFRSRHASWFNVDRVATMRAMEVAEKSRLLGASPAEQLEDAERVVRAEFPKLFPAPAKPPAAVQSARSRSSGGTGKKGFAEMPQASQDMARDYLKRHGVPLEQFAASYWSDPANQERKVG